MFTLLSPAQRWQYILIVTVALCYFMSASMMLYMPKYVLAIGGNEQDAGWILGVSLLPVLILSPFIGRASDVWGSKPLVMLGLLLYAGSTLAMSYVEHVGVSLYVWRFLQGLGHAGVFSPLFAAVARLVPEAHRARGIGYFTVCIQFGNTLGSFLGEVAIATWSYFGLFWVSGCSVFLAMVALLFVENHTPNKAAAAQNSQGVISSSSPLTFYAYFGVLLVLGSCFGVALQFMPIYFDFLLSEGFVDTAISNIYFMTTTLMTVAAVRIFLGGLSDGKHSEKVANICHIVLFASLILFSFIRSEASAIVVSVIFGLSYGLLYPTVNSKIIAATHPSARGRISGMLTTFYELGFRGVPMVLGMVVYQLSYVAMFYFLAGAYLLAAVVLLASRYYESRKERALHMQYD